jgi:AcrR family transcriptional regulator
VASAVRLIEAGGPGAFSLREAAREVGVSPTAAYRHFDDKSALMAAAASEGYARLARRMQRSMDGASARRTERVSVARFKAVGRAYVSFAFDHPSLFRLMFSECAAGGLSAAEGQSALETPWTLLGRSLDALLVDGVLPEDRRSGAELKAWTVVHGYASLSLDGLVPAATERERAAALESLLNFVVVGLCGQVEAPR